jgi:hypothetical protein
MGSAKYDCEILHNNRRVEGGFEIKKPPLTPPKEGKKRK